MGVASDGSQAAHDRLRRLVAASASQPTSKSHIIQESVDVMEDLLMDFITQWTVEAQQVTAFAKPKTSGYMSLYSLTLRLFARHSKGREKARQSEGTASIG